MDNQLTHKGARSVTIEMDRLAALFQNHHETLGIPPRVAMDYAKRTDLMSDVVERRALANFPREEADGEVVDKTPAADNDPEVPKPTADTAGDTDTDPKSDDQNKPETYYEGGKSKVADEDEKLLRSMLAEEGMDKAATPEWPVQPAKDETGTSVDHGTSGFDANAIGDDYGGPRLQETDEPYMSGEFSQDWFHELRDKQQAGVLPSVDKFAALDAFIGDLDSVIDTDALTKLGSGFNRIVADAANLSRMPGLSPQQLRAKINRIAEVRQEVEVITKQFEDVLKRLTDLEKEEKAGVAELKKAANAMREKGKYLAETEKAMLQFTAYLTDKVPGIAQMIAREDEVKPGLKAGDMFSRIATELGEDVGEAVERIYMATKDDLTYATMAVRGLKIVVKTSSLDEGTLRTAGVVDMVVALREWVAGKADSMAARILNFSGDVSKWVKGFMVRSKIVKKESNGIKGIMASAEKAIEAAFKANPVRTAHNGLPAGDSSVRSLVADEEGCDDADESDAEGCGKEAAESHGYNLFAS